MAATSTTPAARPTMSEQDLRRDVSTLQRLPSSTLSTLLNLTLPTPLRPSAPPKSAVEELKSFAPSSSDPESSLRLSKAYVNDMKAVRSWDDGRIDKLGDGVDQVRRNGEDARDALGDVKL